MNVERMHAISLTVQEELKTDNVVGVFQQLISSLQNQINQPQQPNHQQEVSTYLNTLKNVLAGATSNEFSPAWRMMLQELGFDDYLGNNLLEKIENIFSRNQITPATALTELKEIFSNLNVIDQSLDQILSGFSNLNVGQERLEPGKCEIGILIPREAIENKVENLSKELKEINGIFGTFEEITTGQRRGLELRSLSSSDPSFFFTALPEVAAFTAIAIERTIASYKKLLEIRKLRTKLKNQGVASKDLKGVERHASEIIKTGIEKLIPELFKKFSVVKDESRKNELQNSLRISLNKIANRIDKGFNVEIRTEPFEENDEKNAKEANKKDVENITLILDKSQALRFIRISGEPILSLPENSK